MEIADKINELLTNYLTLQLGKKLNVEFVNDGDLLVIQTAEPLEPEVLTGVKAFINSIRQQRNLPAIKFGILSLGLDESIASLNSDFFKMMPVPERERLIASIEKSFAADDPLLEEPYGNQN